MFYNVFFSANGRTGLCADFVAGLLGGEGEAYNWLWEANRKPLRMTRNDVLLFSMPVYGGYIPAFCAELVKNLQGQDTPAIIMAVYGNRHFDNALIQMKDLLKKQGFKVIAAGAFVAEHSIFPKVGFGRPNKDDYKAMEVFANKCKEILQHMDVYEHKEISVYGEANYDPSTFKGVPFCPDGDETCIRCMQCVKDCPVKAIDTADPSKTDASKCIACGSCICVCPVGARDYHSEIYKKAQVGFEERCKKPMPAFTYYIE